MSTSESDATPTRHPFDRQVEEVKVSKTDINFVILDYLINEGFPEAAKKFADEANIQKIPGDTECIEARVEIRLSILRGNIQDAIERINDLEPELLEGNTTLHFSLLRLQLIELIRKCLDDSKEDMTTAIEFASAHLAPLAPTNPTFLSDLEKTMALLIYPRDAFSPQLEALLQPELRTRVAERVNTALLETMGHQGVSRLRRLARLRMWSERKAREHGCEINESGLDLWGNSHRGLGTGNGTLGDEMTLVV